MLSENNINALLPPCRVSKIYPVGHPNNVCWYFENGQDRIWQDGTMSEFGLLLKRDGKFGTPRDMSTLLEFRHRIMMHLIDRV